MSSPTTQVPTLGLERLEQDRYSADGTAPTPGVRAGSVSAGSTSADFISADTASGRAFRYLAGAARLSIGWIFLWAFLDKTFGLGHETKAASAWIDGGSPTAGFLGKAAAGPFQGVYNDIAGAGWANWMFMAGLLGIGVALMLGIGTRIAAACGALLLLLMWTAVLPPANNPFMDDHIIYALVLGMLALVGAGRTLGFGRTWERLPIVQRYPVLK